MGEWVGWECLGHHMASSPLLLEGRKIMFFFFVRRWGGGYFLLSLHSLCLCSFQTLKWSTWFFSFCDKVQLKANRKYSILVNNPFFGYWRITLLLNCSQARCWDEKYGSTETSEVGYLMVFGLSIFFIAFNLFIRIFLNLICSMGDNLLFMDSPAPSARTSVLQGSQTNEDQTLLEQADSPCGVDKLLNFSPSEIAKVRLKILLESFGSM